MSDAKTAELDLTPLAEIGAHGAVAGPDSTLQTQPSRAIVKDAAREGGAADEDPVRKRSWSPTNLSRTPLVPGPRPRRHRHSRRLKFKTR